MREEENYYFHFAAGPVQGLEAGAAYFVAALLEPGPEALVGDKAEGGRVPPFPRRAGCVVIGFPRCGILRRGAEFPPLVR